MSKEAVDLASAGNKNNAVFTARAEEGKVQLKWETPYLKVFDRFIIERSAEGIHFTPVIVIIGTVFLSHEKKHTTFDLYPPPGKSYYRLRMISPNGEADEFYTEVIY